jgi:hypothetical protein
MALNPFEQVVKQTAPLLGGARVVFLTHGASPPVLLAISALMS